MTDIIQIFKWHENIKKPDYNTARRRSVGAWKSIDSYTGYLDFKSVVLPIECKNDPTLKNADLIIIQDINDFNPFLENKYLELARFPDWYKNAKKTRNLQLKGFTTLSKGWTFEIFKFNKNKNENIDVSLNYSDTLGIPKRENHKIAELTLGKPIRYKINGRHDFTMSDRTQRTFSELDFIIEYMGRANTIEFKEMNKIIKTKSVPLAGCKIIDERKIFK